MKKVLRIYDSKIIFEINEPMTTMSVEYGYTTTNNDRILGWARCHDEDLFDIQTGMAKAFDMSKKYNLYDDKTEKKITKWIKKQHYSEPIEKFIANRVKRHPEEFARLDNKKLKYDYCLDGNMTSIIELYVKDWFDKENFKASVNKDCTDAINALAKRYPGLTFKLDYEPK